MIDYRTDFIGFFFGNFGFTNISMFCFFGCGIIATYKAIDTTGCCTCFLKNKFNAIKGSCSIKYGWFFSLSQVNDHVESNLNKGSNRFIEYKGGDISHVGIAS